MAGQGTIVATGSIAYPAGPRRDRRADRRREGDDADLDLRPPRHPGRGVRALPRAHRGAARRRRRLLRGRLRARSGVAARAAAARAPSPPAPAAGAASRARARSCSRRRRPPNALVRSLRTHGHLAASLDPLGSTPPGRPGARPAVDRPDAGADGADPLEAAAHLRSRATRSPRPSRTCATPTAARSPTRSSTSPRTSSGAGCARRSRAAPSASRSAPEEQRALLTRLIEVDALERFMHKAYLGQHQFSIEGVDMTVPMLDEMIRLSAAGGAHEVVDRDGPPRPAQRARPQPRPPLRDDLRRVRGRLDARGGDDDPAGRHRRRQVPPRRPGLLPARRRADRSRSTSSPTPRTSSTSARS